MKRTPSRYIHILFAALVFAVAAISTAAQSTLDETERQFVEQSGDGTLYTLGFVAIAGLGLGVFLWRRSQRGKNKPVINDASRYKNYYSSTSHETDGRSAEREPMWPRKTETADATPRDLSFEMKPQKPERRSGIRATNSAGIDEEKIDTKVFQEKMRKMRYTQLPINSISELHPASDFEPLPVSDDASLLNAIEQAYDEYEEDEVVRELSLKILTAFRTKNSVEALSQLALYDLSANLRSKAVGTLTDFDHEAVFEAILLACADPTREVRAAAARGLFRLSFDRADAWKRIIETGDEFRIRHAARAAVEAGIVTKSFERLIHEDAKIAYEAFVLVALMIQAGETKEVFDAIRGHKDERVRFALLHVLKSMLDERTLEELERLRGDESLSSDVLDRVNAAIRAFEHVPA